MKLESKCDPQSKEFIENDQYYSSLVSQLEQRKAQAELGGGKASQERLKERGKLTARERIQEIIDPGSYFMELSPLAGYGLYEDDVPQGGIVTGIGIIHQRAVMLVANDPTVKGGTYYPITVRKHLRAQQIAEQQHLPCIYLVDSGGAFLPMQDEVFPDHDDFGRIFFNQAQMSAKGIPQISAVHGFCTAGGAYIPAMSDQSVIVNGTGTIFLAGPPLVKAATGEDVSAEDLGGAKVHTSVSGVADHIAEDDSHALTIIREIVNHLGEPKRPSIKFKPPEPPAYPIDSLLGVIPKDSSKTFDMREIIARIVDGSRFFEFKKNYGKTLVSGFAHIEGMPVGILANNGILFSESALKGTHFIEVCCQEKIPILFFQNITGFMVGKKYEHGGIAKDGAKMVHAVANAKVPKITVIMGGSYGAGNYGMCGRAFDPRFMFMWPGARISVMGGEQAAGVLATVKQTQMSKKGRPLTEEELDEIKRPILEKYQKESEAYYSTSRLWDDGIITPQETRKVLAAALCSSLFHEWEDTKNGIFRM